MEADHGGANVGIDLDALAQAAGAAWEEETFEAEVGMIAQPALVIGPDKGLTTIP